jgi:hypothetical protein
MSEPIVYVDRSDVHEGALVELRGAMAEFARFVEENEPQLLSYSVYFSDDGARMTVVHVHADSASLDYHLDVIGPRLEPLAGLLTMTSIEIFGEPSETALQQLQDKVRLLGSGDVIVHSPHAGFTRLELVRRGAL